MLGLLALMALGAVAGAVQLRSARADLLIARAELESVARRLGEAQTAPGRAALRAATSDAVVRTERARDRLRGSFPLQVIGVLPGASTQRTGLIAAADVAAGAARVASDLAAQADKNVDAVTLKSGSIDLRALARFAEDAADAAERIRALPRSHRRGQWGALARATRELDDVVTDAGSRLSTGAGTMRATAGLLGAAGPRRYLIALQNNAEMRDQGMVLSYAVAEAVDGRIRVVRSGRTTELELRRPVTDISLGEGTRRVFESMAPLQFWQSVNAWADAGLSGRVMMSMYRAATGETVDGVIAMDVPALAGLLRVTGPVNVVGIAEPIGADNAARLLLNDLYAADPADRGQRREHLAEVAAAVTERIQNSTLDAAALADALGTAAAGGHLRVTSGVAAEDKAFVAAGLAGGPAARHAERTLHVSVQNGTATKLDYFVQPSVHFDVSVTTDNSAVVTARVDIANNSPVPTPPGYQFGPDGVVQFTPGLYKARVYFWSPKGSEQLNGVSDSGLMLGWGGTDVAAGQTGRLEFTAVIPNAVRDGELRLRFVPQPRLSPANLTVSVAGIGRRVLQTPSVPKSWDRTLDLAWELSDAA